MKKTMSLSLALLALAGCGQSKVQTQPAPSVAVTATKPARGSLWAQVTAYGSAGPSQNGAQTINAAQPGQIADLLVVPGATVHAGQPLLHFAIAPTARSAYVQASDALAAAQKQRATTAQLLNQQLATADQLAQADKAVSDARATVDALAAEGAALPVRPLAAPFDGVVTAITVAPGDRTQPGAPLLTLARTSDIVVAVGVDPSVRAGIAIGQTAELRRLAGGPAIAGNVLRVGNALDPRTRMIDVELAIPRDALMPGEAMQAVIDTNRIAGWVVPHKAVVTAAGPARVFQAIQGKAKVVQIRVLLFAGANDVVDGPIDPADPLIVDGAYQVQDGDAVRFGK